MENMDKFNQLVALIFSDLYSSFPLTLEISSGKYLKEIIDKEAFNDSFDFSDFFRDTVAFLQRERFIHIQNDSSSGSEPCYSVQLTKSGLTILNGVPSALEGKDSIGKRFIDFSQSAAKDTVSSLIQALLSGDIIN